jgi:phosphomannomutase
MSTNPNIFKAYDIRGVYGVDLDDETAYKIGYVYAQMRKKELPLDRPLRIAVGADMRLSSPMLKEKLIKGLINGGVDVIDIGLASTPTFYFAVANYNYDGGVLVSASHNPKEYNGFKMVRQKALPVSGEGGLYELRDMVAKLEMADIKPPATPNSLSANNSVQADQVQHDLRFADHQKINKFKIVIDPANAMGAQYFDELFKNLPQMEIVRMNWELDGTFPVHEADPFKEENLYGLCERVKTENADLGIATDGDGDRIFFVDNNGLPVEPGITRAILCKIFLRENPGAKICYDIRPGKITYDTIVENGGMPIVTRVGHSLIKQKTIEEGAVFAGESSGHFFLNMGEEGCYEVPLIVTLKILSEISMSGQSFSEYIKPYKRYFHSGEINSRVENSADKIKEIKEKYNDGQQNDLDGITIEYPDFWFNVRGSNTEPLLRLNLEAKTKEVMEEKRDEVLGLIRN